MLETSGAAEPVPRPARRPRRWYRYHHLFADVLHARLLDERPERRAGLHRRASDGTTQAGDPESAVRHALAAGDVDLAADLVELAMPGAASRAARGDHPPLDRRAPRRDRAPGAGAGRRVHRRPDGEQRVRRRRAATATTSNSVSRAAADDVIVIGPGRAGAPARAWWRPTGPRWRSSAETRGDRRARRDARWPARPTTTTSPLVPHRPSSGSRLDRWGPGGGTRRVPSVRRRPAHAGHVADVLGLHHRADRHRADPGAAGRGSARTPRHALELGRPRRRRGPARDRRHARRC